MANFKEQASMLSKHIFDAFANEAKTKISTPKVYYSNGLETALNPIDGNTVEDGYGSNKGNLVCCRLKNATFYITDKVKEGGSARIRFTEEAGPEMNYVNMGWRAVDLRLMGPYDVIGTAIMFKIEKDAKVTFMYNPGTRNVVAPYEKAVTAESIASEVKSIHKKFKTFFISGVTAEAKTLTTLLNLKSILTIVTPVPQKEAKKQTLEGLVNCPECKTERDDKENFCPHCGYDYRKS